MILTIFSRDQQPRCFQGVIVHWHIKSGVAPLNFDFTLRLERIKYQLQPVAWRVYTADALHTHPPFFQRIQALHGHTVLMVKGNQPTLQEHLVTYFADPLASFEQACTIDLQRGRKEVRSLKVTAALN